MLQILTALKFSNDPLALTEWFVASVGLLIAVTLIYVLILNKSPPPEGLTVAKIEKAEHEAARSSDVGPLLNQAQQDLQLMNFVGAVEISAQAVSTALHELLRASGSEQKDMGISDMAYLVESKAKNSPQFSSWIYQLNTLRLRALQGHTVSQQEAAWAVSIASWLINNIANEQIKF